jgi:hypothetical protein
MRWAAWWVQEAWQQHAQACRRNKTLLLNMLQ